MLLLLIIILIFNILIYRSFLNPIILQSILWLIYYIVLNFNIESFNIIIEDAYYFIIFQLVGFSLGGLIYKLIHGEKCKENNLIYFCKEEIYNIVHIKYNISLLYPIIVITLLAATYFLLRESSSISLLNVQDLRETLVEDDGKKYGTYGLIQLIVTVYVLIFISIGGKFSFKYKFLFILFFVFTYLLGSRGQFIFFLVPLCYLLCWQKRVNFSKVLGGITIFALIMVLVTYSKSNDLDDDSLSKMLLIYTTASLPALVIESSPPLDIFGANTFRVIYLWLNKVGFTFSINTVVSKWTSTPLPTNIYTYLKPYYYDFGLTGIIVLPAILGFIYNLLYFRAKKNKRASLLMLSLLTYPMIMQTSEEFYYRWMSNWIYIYIFIKLVTKIKIYGRWSSNRNLQS